MGKESDVSRVLFPVVAVPSEAVIYLGHPQRCTSSGYLGNAEPVKDGFHEFPLCLPSGVYQAAPRALLVRSYRTAAPPVSRSAFFDSRLR